MTDERRRKIREAALEVFLRYGYRRVTMDDIARGVGVSRPALYLVFSNKEAVFRDVVEAGLDDLLRQIEAGLDPGDALATQLTHVFEVSSVRTFELVARAPAAAELMTASFDFSRDLFDRYDARLAEVVARLIRAAVEDPGALRPSAEARARVMIAAAHGFKATARDAQEMRSWVGDLVQVTVAGLPALGSRAPRRRQGASPVATGRSRR